MIYINYGFYKDVSLATTHAPDCPPFEKMRQFDTGATRDSDIDKYDYEAFLSPLVLERYAQYLHKHRKRADGTLRDGDNWQRGIPRSVYMKSGWRHFMDWWKGHRGLLSREALIEAICAVLFNVQGYLFELLQEDRKGTTALSKEEEIASNA